MSFLAGIARRAAETAADPSALQPKDRLLPRRFLGRREVEPEAEEAEETAQPARRQAAGTLSREVTTEGTGWSEEDEGVATTEGVPARRMAAPAAPIVQPERSLEPGEPPPEEETPKPEAAASLKPPNTARALRRRTADSGPAVGAMPVPVAGGAEMAGPAAEAGPVSTPGAPASGPFRGFEADSLDAEGEPWAGIPMESSPAQPVTPADWPPREAGSAAWSGPEPSPAAAGWRPSAVTIEQIDVLIHEPVPAAAPDTSRRDRARSIDARYLRRL